MGFAHARPGGAGGQGHQLRHRRQPEACFRRRRPKCPASAAANAPRPVRPNCSALRAVLVRPFAKSGQVPRSITCSIASSAAAVPTSARRASAWSTITATPNEIDPREVEKDKLAPTTRATAMNSVSLSEEREKQDKAAKLAAKTAAGNQGETGRRRVWPSDGKARRTQRERRQAGVDRSSGWPRRRTDEARPENTDVHPDDGGAASADHRQPKRAMPKSANRPSPSAQADD
jgi:hypothetical protein